MKTHYFWLVCYSCSLVAFFRVSSLSVAGSEIISDQIATTVNRTSYNNLKILLQHLANKTLQRTEAAARPDESGGETVRSSPFVKCSNFYFKAIRALSRKIGNALFNSPNRKHDQEFMKLLVSNFDCLFQVDDDSEFELVSKLLNLNPLDRLLFGLLPSSRKRVERSLMSENMLLNVDRSHPKVQLKYPKTKDKQLGKASLGSDKFKLRRFYRIEFLFEDDFIFSYDLLFNTHKMFGSSSMNANRTSEVKQYNVFVNENISVGSFICYVIVNNYEIIESASKNRATYTSSLAKAALEATSPGSLDSIYFTSDDNSVEAESAFVLEPTNFGSSRMLADNQINVSLHSSPSFKRFINLYTLKLAKQLDREARDTFHLKFFMRNEPNKMETMVAKLNVFVNDTNDNAPRFQENFYRFKLSENNVPDQCFGSVRARDPDLEANGTVRYFLDKVIYAFKPTPNGFSRLKVNTDLNKLRKLSASLSSSQNEYGYYTDLFQNYNVFNQNQIGIQRLSHSGTFYIDEVTGQVCANATFDREEFDSYVLKVFAQDLGAAPLTNAEPCLIKIDVIDKNDNAPRFYLLDTFEHNMKTLNVSSRSFKPDRFVYSDNQHLEFYLNEDSPPLTFIAMVKAYDVDKNENALIEYQLEVEESYGIAKRDELTGSHKKKRWKEAWTGRLYGEDLFGIDSNGVIRSVKRMRLRAEADAAVVLSTDPANSTSAVDEEDVSFVDTRAFTLKIRARDRGRPQLENSMEIKVVLIRPNETIKLKAKVEGIEDPAVWASYEKSSLFWNKMALGRNEPLFKLKAARQATLEGQQDEAIESILASSRSNEPVFYSYQILPRRTDFMLNFNSKMARNDQNASSYNRSTFSPRRSVDMIDYGINCKQSELVKYFSINRIGELNTNNSVLDEAENDLRICFLNVRVVDVVRANEFNDNVEIALVLSNLDESRSLERIDELIGFLRSKSDALSFDLDGKSFKYVDGASEQHQHSAPNILIFDWASSDARRFSRLESEYMDNSSDLLAAYNESLADDEMFRNQRLIQLKRKKTELSRKFVVLTRMLKRMNEIFSETRDDSIRRSGGAWASPNSSFSKDSVELSQIVFVKKEHKFLVLKFFLAVWIIYILVYFLIKLVFILLTDQYIKPGLSRLLHINSNSMLNTTDNQGYSIKNNLIQGNNGKLIPYTTEEMMRAPPSSSTSRRSFLGLAKKRSNALRRFFNLSEDSARSSCTSQDYYGRTAENETSTSNLTKLKKALVQSFIREKDKPNNSSPNGSKGDSDARSKLSSDAFCAPNRDGDFGFGAADGVVKLEESRQPSPKDGHGKKKRLHILKRLHKFKDLIGINQLAGFKDSKLKSSKADNAKRKHFNMYESSSAFRKNCDEYSGDSDPSRPGAKRESSEKPFVLNPTQPFRIMNHDSMFSDPAKRVNCGLYKVSDQIIIDYDDNKQIQFQNYFLEDMFLFDHEDQTSNPSFTQLSEHKKPENGQKNYQPSFDGTNQVSSDHILVESAENIHDPFFNTKPSRTQDDQDASKRSHLNPYESAQTRFSSHDISQDYSGSTYNQIQLDSLNKKSTDLNIKDPFERFEKIYYDDLNS